MSQNRTLLAALARVLRQPGRLPALLFSALRVWRTKGWNGVRSGVAFWGAPEPASFPPSVAENTLNVAWFRDPNGPYPAWIRGRWESIVGASTILTPFRLVRLADPIPFPVADEDWLAFLHEGDTLSPNAATVVSLAIAEYPNADLFYSDEDVALPDGTPLYPRFKPEFCPDLLDETGYCSRLLVMRGAAYNALGGLDTSFGSAATYDLTLRASEQHLNFVRLPDVLTRRAVPDVDSLTPSFTATDETADFHANAKSPLIASLKRRGETEAIVRDGREAGTFRVDYPLPEPRPLISIIIPFRDKPELLRTCVESILTHTTYAPYELILLDNGSALPETCRLLDRLSHFPQVRVINHDAPFNYSAINNHAVRAAKGEYLVLLNNDTEVITPDWLEQLLRQCARPGVGAVGATLRFADGTIQHAGVAMGMTGLAGHPFAGLRDEEVPCGWHRHTRSVSAVTAACLMTPLHVWESLAGLDERFIVCGNDVDYCLRVRRQGLRVLHVPHAELYHYETQSRDPYKVLGQDLDMSAITYAPFLGTTDPYWNPNLTVATTRASLRQPGEMQEPEPPKPTTLPADLPLWSPEVAKQEKRTP